MQMKKITNKLCYTYNVVSKLRDKTQELYDKENNKLEHRANYSHEEVELIKQDASYFKGCVDTLDQLMKMFVDMEEADAKNN